MVSSLSMKLIKYQSEFRLTETCIEHDPKVVASMCSWKVQVVCSQGHFFTLAVRCPLWLGTGMRCWPDTADLWQGSHTSGTLPEEPTGSDVLAAAEQDASPMERLDQQVLGFHAPSLSVSTASGMPSSPSYFKHW